MITKKHASLATILYADIFDFPLTGQETVYWSIGHKEPAPVLFKKKKNYVVIPGREDLVHQREKRKEIAKRKWIIARDIARILRWIPTIDLVGVTGGLAMDNAKGEDDIDFLCIVHSETMWMSRLLATVTLELLGKRRRRGDTMVTDAICLNMFMSRKALTMPKQEQDLYSAHEVLQMRPMWERNNAYRHFLMSNKWVQKFLPNAWNVPEDKPHVVQNTFVIELLKFFEPLARELQLFYMQSHRTREIITQSMIRFHPRDARVWVKEALAIRLKRYKIPLDKVFYGR